jgi:hypothetical protein
MLKLFNIYWTSDNVFSTKKSISILTDIRIPPTLPQPHTSFYCGLGMKYKSIYHFRSCYYSYFIQNRMDAYQLGIFSSLVCYTVSRSLILNKNGQSFPPFHPKSFNSDSKKIIFWWMKREFVFFYIIYFENNLTIEFLMRA